MISSLAIVLAIWLPSADPMPQGSLGAREALKPFNLLVGSWKGTGVPDTVGGSKTKEFWTETVRWTWQFQGDDAWLSAAFEKNPKWKSAELRYDTTKKQFALTIHTMDDRTITYRGDLTAGQGKDQVLSLERTDETEGSERLVFTLLHHNRYLYRLDTKAPKAASYTRRFQVGVTKDGTNFAEVPKGPECIVSGGTGTSRVVHNGKTYYVCCSGCRDAFKDNPEKFIKEYEAKQKDAEKKNQEKK